MGPVSTYRPVTSRQVNLTSRVSAAYGQADFLELLEVAITRLGHGSPQATDEVQRAERIIGRAGQHLPQRWPLTEGDLQQSAARQRRVRSGGRPEPAVPQRLGRYCQRRAEHHRVGAARDGFGQVSGSVDVAVG